MPAKQPWKVAERAVAARLGGTRLVRHRGGKSTDLGDVLVDGLFVEVKYRQSHGAFAYWRDAHGKATDGQVPIVVLREAGSPKMLVVVEVDDLRAAAALIPKEAPNVAARVALDAGGAPSAV